MMSGAPRLGTDRPLSPVNLHLGIDFGTRFTKVCFRDLGRERSEIVTFARVHPARLEDALLSSRLEIRSGRVHGGLTEGEWGSLGPGAQSATVLEFLKIRLAQLDIKEIGSDWPFTDTADLTTAPDAIEALAAFYLARVIDRSRRWISEKRRELLVGRQPLWSVSLGVPVEYCDSPALVRFRKVLRVALTWADAGVEPTLSILEVRRAAHSFSDVVPEADCEVVPELGAAVRSFIASPQAAQGVYVFVDVGAGTLDGVSFRYLRVDGRPRLVCHAAIVAPLGVAALSERLAARAGAPSQEIEKALSQTQNRVRHTIPGLNEAREDLWTLVAGILLEGKRKDASGWSAGIETVTGAYYRQRGDMTKFPFFLGGGGSLSRFYRDAIASTYGARPLASANIKPYRLEHVPVPSDLDVNDLPREHIHRFAVAYGLSIPPGESGDLDLPSTVSTEGPRSRRPPRTTPYADTKDLT